jgi:hypothetical protein
MTKSPRRRRPLYVLFHGYRRRINRLALKKAMARLSRPVTPSKDLWQYGPAGIKHARLGYRSAPEIVGVFQKRLQKEYGPAVDLPANMVRLVEQLSETEKASPLSRRADKSA